MVKEKKPKKLTKAELKKLADRLKGTKDYWGAVVGQLFGKDIDNSNISERLDKEEDIFCCVECIEWKGGAEKDDPSSPDHMCCSCAEGESDF